MLQNMRMDIVKHSRIAHLMDRHDADHLGLLGEVGDVLHHRVRGGTIQARRRFIKEKHFRL